MDADYWMPKILIFCFWVGLAVLIFFLVRGRIRDTMRAWGVGREAELQRRSPYRGQSIPLCTCGYLRNGGHREGCPNAQWWRNVRQWEKDERRRLRRQRR